MDPGTVLMVTARGDGGGAAGCEAAGEFGGGGGDGGGGGWSAAKVVALESALTAPWNVKVAGDLPKEKAVAGSFAVKKAAGGGGDQVMSLLFTDRATNAVLVEHAGW